MRLDGKFPEDALAAQAALQAADLDVLVVAAYGLILPAWVLAVPRHGCLNIHGSLLPRWRGAAPIHRAIEAGDTRTGVTIMQMDAGLDTGDMLRVSATEIGPDETTGQLHDRLAVLGASSLLLTLEQLALGALQPSPQPAEGVSYAHKIAKAEAALDWTLPAEVLARRVRAFDPFPGCTAQLLGETVKVWRAQAVAGSGQPGAVVQAGEGRLMMGCGSSLLDLLEVQRAGGRRISAREFLQRQAPAAG
jgi:methionyl-tRNA formyltransferase